MAEMTPRERSELVRSQSRAYIAALRASRLQRAGKTVPINPPVTSFPKVPSAFYPSRQATARAFEAKAKPAAQPETVLQASRDQADTLRRDADASLGQLREARRPRKPRAAKTGTAVMQAALTARDASEIMATGTPLPKVKPTGKDLPKGSADHPDLASAMSNDTSSATVVHRRARPKRSSPAEQPAGVSGNHAAPQDIEVISGLGPALKSKLRRAGIGTTDILASQTPQRLREVLGPAGRLVNLDALVRAAATACAGAQAAPRKVESRAKSAPSSQTSF